MDFKTRYELSIPQLNLVEMDYDENKLIIGGPGSGKTHVLLHRANYIREEEQLSDNEFRLFVYTNSLKNYIKPALVLLSIDEENVVTIDSWCKNFYEDNINHVLPKIGNKPDFNRISEEVSKHIEENAEYHDTYKFSVVDEGQDLSLANLYIIYLISEHVTVCADNKQQIYENRVDTTEIREQLYIEEHDRPLIETFRCSPFIVDLASKFITDHDDQNEYIAQTRTHSDGRETPIIYCAEDFDDERNKLFEMLNTRIIKGDSIGILFPQNAQVYGFAEGLKGMNIEVETTKKHDFNNNSPKLMSFHSSKGLTFDSVFLVRLNTFRHQTQEELNRLMFVGISRATEWAYISTTDPDTILLLKSIIENPIPNIFVSHFNDTNDSNEEDNDDDEFL